jgi:hypothetical protein
MSQPMADQVPLIHTHSSGPDAALVNAYWSKPITASFAPGGRPMTGG